LASWEPPEFLVEKILIPFFNTLKHYKCWLWTRGYGLGWEHFEVIVLEWWWLLCFEKREMECVCVGGKNPETYANSYFQIWEFKIWVFGYWVVEDAGLNELGGGDTLIEHSMYTLCSVTNMNASQCDSLKQTHQVVCVIKHYTVWPNDDAHLNRKQNHFGQRQKKKTSCKISSCTSLSFCILVVVVVVEEMRVEIN